MNYEDVRDILGEAPVRLLEQAVDQALVASRAAGKLGGAEALELLLTSQLAAVIITRSGHPDPLEAAERVSEWLHILVEEAVKIREEAALEARPPIRRTLHREFN